MLHCNTYAGINLTVSQVTIPHLKVGRVRVTHPCAGRHQDPKSHAAPRLACIKPPASVHPEPGSNSPYSIILIFEGLCSTSSIRLLTYFPVVSI